MSFESSQNKQQYGTKITCTEIRGKGYGGLKFYLFFNWGGGGGGGVWA